MDFISFHAKGAPFYVNETDDVPGHLQMNMSAALHNVDDAFSVISGYETLNDLPIFIGEDDPDGCAACVSSEIDYRNGLIYPSYTVASFSRQLDLAVKYGVNLVGTLTWAFEFSNHPIFDKSRVLATNQINKPILNIFRMFGKMQTKQLDATSTGQYSTQSVLTSSVRDASDVGVLASTNVAGTKTTVMIWNHHDDDLPKPDAQISLKIFNALSGSDTAKVTHYRIDESHSNAYAVWLAMGSPLHPTEDQYANLRAAGDLAMLYEPATVKLKDGQATLQFNLPIHAISLLVIEEP